MLLLVGVGISILKVEKWRECTVLLLLRKITVERGWIGGYEMWFTFILLDGTI